MTSLGTPFSLATASTTSNNSLLIDFDSRATAAAVSLVFRTALARSGVLIPGACSADSECHVIRHQPGLDHVDVADRHFAAVLVEHDAISIDADDPALESMAAVERHTGAHLGRTADEALEMFQREQWPIDSRRGNLKRIATFDRIVDVHLRGNFAADPLAILDCHRAFPRVDENAQQAAAATLTELDANEFQAEVGEQRLQKFIEFLVRHCDCLLRCKSRQKKMGARP